MDVGSREIVSKRLNVRSYDSRGKMNGITHHDISSETIIVPDNARIEFFDQELPLMATAWKRLRIVQGPDH